MEIAKLTTADLEQLLADRKKQEKQAREREKTAYEDSRDKMVDSLVTRACFLAAEVAKFKDVCHKVMDEQAIKLAEYGLIRGNSKGGFSVLDKQGIYKVSRTRDTRPAWDERAVKAIELIKEFLTDTVKKRDLKMFEILISFLEKNKAGDLEYSKVFTLLMHEDKFADPRWLEGLKLLKESYNIHLKGFGYEFKTMDDKGKWQPIVLNFSSL